MWCSLSTSSYALIASTETALLLRVDEGLSVGMEAAALDKIIGTEQFSTSTTSIEYFDPTFCSSGTILKITN